MKKRLLVLSAFALMAASALAQAPYCTAPFSSLCSSGDFINGFTFNTINNLNTGCIGTANNYANYTSQTTSVSQGTAYAVTCRPGPSWGQYFSVWIDLNNNNVLTDAGEFFPIGYAAAGGLVTANITIPTGVTSGAKRMRVRCTFGTGAHIISDACSSRTWGETEDYTVTVGPPPPCPQPSALTVSGINDTGATLNWTGPANAATWTVQYGPQGFTLGTGTIVTGLTTNSYTITNALAPGTNYSFYAYADCGPTDGISLNSGPVNFTTTCITNALPGDTYQNPVVASSLPFSATGTTNSVCVNNNSTLRASKDVYYLFQTSPCAATVTVSLCGSGFDTYLYLMNYTGQGTPLAFNDDGCGSSSTLTYNVTPNTLYYALIEGFSATSQGNYVINITETSSNGGAPSLYFDTAPPTCSGAADGYVNVGICGGTAPFTIIWDDVDTTGTRTNLTPGNHVVKVIDSAVPTPNILTSSFFFPDVAPMEVNINTPDTTLCSGGTLQLDGTFINGTEYRTTPNMYAITSPTSRLVRFYKGSTSTLQNVSAPLPAQYTGADFTDLGYMAIDNSNRQLTVVDTASGGAFNIGFTSPAPGEQWSGLAFSPIDSFLYATATTGSASTLYIIDRNTAGTFTVGNMGIANALWIAIDNNGLAYALDGATNSLYSVDLLSGAATLIGAVGFDAEQGQDADFDPVDNTLYTTAFNNATSRAELRSIDVTTGASTFMSNLANVVGGRVDALAIAPYTGGFTYNWSPATGLSATNILNPVATISSDITYTLQVTDACGFVVTDDVVISVPAPMTNAIASTSVDCAGNNSANVDLTVAGGAAPLTYNWNNNTYTTEDLSNVGAGIYLVNYTDACGTVGTTSVTITEPTVLATTVDASANPSCNGLADGEVMITAAGGTAPYSYEWSNGSTDEDLIGVADGIYTVTTTDANGCTLAVASSQLVSPAVVGFTLDNTANVSCFGSADGSINITPNGGTPPYTFTWSNNATSEDITGLEAGTYVGIITDVNGCRVTSPSVAITQPLALGLSFVTTNETAQGANNGTSTVIATEGTAPYTYAWQGGGNTPTVGGLAPGSHDVTVTDANGCTVVGTATVNFFVGLGDIAGLTQLILTPNPASDVATLSMTFETTKSEVTVEVFNSLAQRISIQTTSNVQTRTFDLGAGDLANGTYFVRITADGQTLTKQLVIAKP